MYSGYIASSDPYNKSYFTNLEANRIRAELNKGIYKIPITDKYFTEYPDNMNALLDIMTKKGKPVKLIEESNKSWTTKIRNVFCKDKKRENLLKNTNFYVKPYNGLVI